MQTAPTVLSLLLVILSCTGWTNGLCDLENGTMARCQELKDVKYIETYHLETLKAPVLESHLRPGNFDSLTSLRHLDLSGGYLKRIDAGCFRNLTNLRSLNLAENQIASLYTGAFQKLPHLHSLNLRKNKLRHLAPVITELKALKHLDVQGNPLQCDCSTLLVRDMILKNGVKISKKVLCAGPKNMKSTPLFKPDASMVCSLEEQDRQMQNDQAVAQDESDYEGSGTGEVERPIDEEFIDIPVIASEPPKEPEIETPAPETECLTTDTDCPGKLSSKEDELFFDSAEKKDQIPIAPTIERKKLYKDALFNPFEGSGVDEDGSGEGSGTDATIFDGWDRNVDKDETTHSEEESQSIGDKLLDTLFNVFLSTTAAPEKKKDLDLEEEQFLNIPQSKGSAVPDETEETAHEYDNNDNDLVSTTKIDTETTRQISTTVDYSGVEEFGDDKQANLTQTHESKTTNANMVDELAEVSPAKQSKKGMGSYVVLATLLAILASLIMFAAYKGDFCRKKRKRGDVENGTEMKDLQKALLDSGNAAHPKVVTNGNVENVPLVEDTADHEVTKGSGDHQDSARSQNGTADRVDPVKPPRKRSSFDESTSRNDSLSARTSPVDVTVNNAPPLPANGPPPLSPSAQRVKITLQENPDSVPKTPILITRTMAGDNLVKSP